MIKHLLMLLVVGVIATTMTVQTASATGSSLDPTAHWAVEADVGTIQQALSALPGQRMLVQAVLIRAQAKQTTAKQATTVGTRCFADIPPVAATTTTNVAGVGTAGTSPPSATTSCVSPPTLLVASGATLLATETQEVARNAIMLSASAGIATKTIVAVLPSRAQTGAAKTVSGVEATTGTMGQIATHQSFYVCGAAVDKEESTTHGTLRV